ncbi:hypothetical protein FB446DRAFT_642748, partial [Lentinula raphanica]
MTVLAPALRRVPVPIGPAIPRRDRPDVFERYSRLMLILFKPWRTHSDLRKPGQCWSESFIQFRNNCSLRVKSSMDNMQVLHECKDSRDDHFEQRR